VEKIDFSFSVKMLKGEKEYFSKDLLLLITLISLWRHWTSQLSTTFPTIYSERETKLFSCCCFSARRTALRWIALSS